MGPLSDRKMLQKHAYEIDHRTFLRTEQNTSTNTNISLKALNGMMNLQERKHRNSKTSTDKLKKMK